MINALVLAAGESKRMGMPKPLLRFGDTTFLEQIVSVLQSSEVGRITVVLGARAGMIQTSTDLSGVDVVLNKDYREGQLSSLIVGLKSLPPEAEAILLCLVDNPFITVESADGVVGAFRVTGKPIVVPVFEGRRGHPSLFARPMFDDLLNAPPEEGARYVVQSHRDQVFEVGIPEPFILTRIDTPEDYRSHFGMAPRIIEQ